MKIDFLGKKFYSGTDLLEFWNATDEIDDETGSQGLWDLSREVMDLSNDEYKSDDEKQCGIYYLLQQIAGELNK